MKRRRQDWNILAIFIFVFAAILSAFVIIRNHRQSDSISRIDQQFDQKKLRPLSVADHYRGNITAPVKIIIFSDPECQYCKNLHENILPRVVKRYGNAIVIAYRHMLLPRYQRSLFEAEGIECAGIVGSEQAFWRYVDTLYATTPAEDGLDPRQIYAIASGIGLDASAFRKCLETHLGLSRINVDRQEALLNDIATAPTLVVTADHRSPIYLPGSYPGPLYAAIDSMLLRNSIPARGNSEDL